MNNKTNIKEDIDFIEKMIKEYKTFGNLASEEFEDTDKIYQAIENILADREKLIEENKETLSYQILCDYLISSVDNKEPVWTEKHIKELLANFNIKWKE